MKKQTITQTETGIEIGFIPKEAVRKFTVDVDGLATLSVYIDDTVDGIWNNVETEQS